MNIKTTGFIALLLIAGRIETAQAADGPSYDCAKAASPVDKAICGSAELAKLDRSVADAYKAVLDQLSEPGKNAVRDGQRQWIKLTRTICGADKNQKSADIAQCLLPYYSRREEELQKAVTLQSGLKFYTVNIFKAARREDEDISSDRAFAPVAIAYPQIDAPKSSSETGWNVAVANLVQKDIVAGNASDASEVGVNYGSVEATDKLISVYFSWYMVEPGMAHQMANDQSFHWLIGPARALKAEDVFAANSAWKKTLAQASFKQLKDVEDLLVKKAADLEQEAAAPRNWTFYPDRLLIDFGIESVAAYASGPQSAEIPWSALKPYLSKTAPIAIAP